MSLAEFACLGLGIFITRKQIKIFQAKEQDDLGFDVKLLGGGIMAIILGIALIVQYL